MTAKEAPEDRFRQIVYGVAAAATITYGGWLGFQVTAISSLVTERLTRIETTMIENRSERQLQVEEIRRRLDQLERAVYRDRGHYEAR